MIIDYNHSPLLLETNLETLLGQPQSITLNKIDETSANTFRQSLYKIEISHQPIIPIIIDSYGGYVHSMLTIVDLIESCIKPVYVICTGKAMSAGILLSACAPKGNRYIAKSASVMIHEVSSGNYGKVEELKVSTKEVERLNTLMFSKLDKCCEQEQGFFLEEIHKRKHADWYLTPEEAVEVGIYDYVGIPTLHIDVNVDYKLEKSK